MQSAITVRQSNASILLCRVKVYAVKGGKEQSPRLRNAWRVMEARE